EIEQKITSTDNVNKLMPFVETKVDEFLRVKLSDAFPVISMFIGENTIIAGCVGIAGSAKIGKNCAIGGAAMILGHLSIADNVIISPGSMITRSIKNSGTYTALMPFQDHAAWLKTAAKIKRLK
ncbi:MAG: UDP-3-O-(3-hydroxymyristoyl)-glucosamine N-acyltransferase, partial [Pseudomonadota bacterium]